MSYPRPESFNPADYHFTWTADWYTWDRDAAHKDAKAERDQAAKVARSKGLIVKKSSMPGQLITRGGIGSGKPEIGMYVTVYTLTAI